MSVDRTVPDNSHEVIWFDGSGVYHDEALDDPIMTDCSVSGDPDNVNRGTEIEARAEGLERCARCEWPDALVIYIAGQKSYHDDHPDREGFRLRCNPMVLASARQYASVRSEQDLEASGIERCENCEQKAEGDQQ